MAYQAWSGAGTVVQMTIASTLTPIPGVDAATGIKFNIPNKPLINVTAPSDTQGKAVTGIAQPSDADMVIFWDPTDTTHAALLTNSLASNVNIAFKVIGSNATGTGITFSGAVASFPPDIAGTKGVSVPIKLIPSTGLTITP